MEWYDIEVDGRPAAKFADLPYLPLLSPTTLSPNDDENAIGKKLGGIIRQGEWAWMARDSMLQIVSLRNGQTISTYEFCESRGYDSCCIKCVEEVFPNSTEIMVVAVVLESFRGPGGGGSYVVLYSVELSNVLSTIELSLHITCARFMDATTCNRTLLQNFDGCLAIGSEEGVVVLLDLNMRKIHQSEVQDASFVPCHIVDYSIPLTDIHRNFRQCQQDGIHFGLQMEVIESPCSIQCLQAIDLIMGLAIGLEDGRLALYDLAELQIFYIARPKPDLAMSSLVKIDYLEPPDDPRPCLYIWTLHENGENLHAVMHNLMYEKRVVEEHNEEEDGRYYFESFLTSAVRLQLPLEATKSEALACQAISTLSSHGEDDSNCLCAISWFSVLEEKNKLLIFDLNQWYKEEMPATLEYGKQPSYLAGYILKGEGNGLHTQLQPNTITHFNSMQRFEEHFYPNSLSFDCSLLHTDGCRRYNWEGAQNRLINLLRVSNASVFLEPNNCFNEILRTRLMPQFTELNLNSTFSKNAKYDIMLSTALENNCVSLLRDCAKSWIDGSFMGDFAVSTGLSLSSLTDWIWKRATDIKTRCNDLCKGLFEFGGYPLDHREQKELCFITRQLKLLYDLLGEILVHAKKQIPERVYSSLENNYNSLRMVSNYQDILLWLLNIGLLPEASPYNAQVNNHHDLVPYPYRELKEMYKKKRSFFAKINDNFISKKTGSCRLVYIDAFIDHACKGSILHEYWLENDGDGLYPPNSIEAMLRVMLVPELDYEHKYAILLYFFLDLNMAIDEEAYKGVVTNFIKFPSVFKLSAALIKTVQSFWNLDHDQFLPAVDEFISPFNKNQCYPQWLVELLIESLLTQNADNLALRILESQPSLISPMLKLKTLLANDLISEAFHFVRSKHDDTLLEIFFTCCLDNGQFGVIRDLALSEGEGMILQNILKASKAPGAESLHFVYLLQKSKYIEAVSYMDELSSKPKSLRSSLHHHNPAHMETPNMVLSAFNTTMTPVTQGLTDVYFRIKNKIKKKDVDNKSPVPLSCQLIKQNANSLLGGIYHSSALSAHFATYYWGELEEEQRQNGAKHLLSSNNAPFLRRAQNETNYVDFIGKNNLSYPQAYKITEKRNLVESELLETADEQLERQKLESQLNPKKKRRLIGQEIVDDLTQFMKMNKQKSINLNANDFKFMEKPAAPVENQTIASMAILTRPLATKPPRRSHEEAQGVPTEIQGILKTHISEPTLLSQDEKNLRFRLPSADLNNSQIQSRFEEIEEMEIAEEEPQTKEYSIKTKHIARSVSEESNKSAVSSSNASEENYYSPLSSQNNSKLDCSNLSRCSFISGPKARKPISRLSAELETQIEARPISRLSGEREPEERARPLSRLSAEREKPKGRVSAEQEKPKARLSAEQEPSTVLQHVQQEEARLSAEREAPIDVKPIGRLETKPTESNSINESRTSPVAYVTALGAAGLSVSGRKSLKSVCKEIEQSENVTQKESTSLAYITAFDKLTNATASYKNTIEMSHASSGFGSISARSTSTGSKMSDFLPKVSSSKVGSTPIKSETKIEAKPPSPAKLSECTTVLGSFDYTGTGSNNIFAMPSVPLEKQKPEKPTEEQQQQMLDTTLGMSTYDFSVLDSTSLQQTKSLLMVTAKDVEVSEEEDISTDGNEANADDGDKETNKDEKNDEEQMEVVEGEDIEPEPETNEVEEKEPEPEPETNEEEKEPETEPEPEPKKVWADLLYSSDDDDCIVLSSSSSYIDDNDYGRAFDFRDSDGEESHRKGDVNVESEKSFDTGEYDDYDEDMEGGETESGDVVEVTDDSSADARQNADHQEESNSEDVKVVEDKNSSSSMGSKSEDGEDPLVATTTNTSETVSSGGETNAQVVAKEVTSTIVAVTSTIVATSSKVEIQINENVTTSTTDISEAQTKPSYTQRGKSSEEELSVKVVSAAQEDKEESKDNNEASTNQKAKKSSELKDYSETLETPEETIKEGSLEEVHKAEVVSKVVEESSNTVDSIEDEQITLRMEEGDSIDAIDTQELRDKKMVKENIEDRAVKSQDIKTDEAPKSVDISESEAGKPNRLRKTSISVDLEPTSQALSSPRRNKRGTSVPPADLKPAAVSSPRRSIRGISMPPADIEPKSVLHASSSRRSIRGTSVTPSDVEVTTVVEPRSAAAPSSRRGIRGTSVPPLDVEPVSSPRSRGTRGISVPPHSVTESESEQVPGTPSRRRSLRASSLQPAGDMEHTPNKREKVEDSENTETNSRAARGSSVPPGVLTGKTSTRRRSIMLDAISEDSTTVDSPSTRTRFRSRLNSNESELDTSIVSTDQTTQTKRSRRVSLSGNAGELPLTPKATRRNSLSSQPETLTPRSQRGRSILSVPEVEDEHISPSPKPADSRKVAVKRKVSADEQARKSTEKVEEEIDDDDDSASSKKRHSPKSETSGSSSALYTSARRLTRTQLAIMEKSAALTQNMDSLSKESNISPPSNKRATKVRPARSTTNVSHESDDAESISSKRSTASSATAAKRRSTRKSVKDKDEHEDDVASVASSLGSEKHPKSRRSKDKGSPNSVLSVIPEDAPVETKKRSRNSTKH